MMKSNRRAFLGSVSAALLSAPYLARAQKKYDDGASDTEIKIGHTCPYSGPASAYGVNGKAIVAFWDMINDKGGINGRKIRFISLDDGYSHPKTVELIRQLVEQERVLCTHNTLGTACNRDPQVHEPEEGAAPLPGDRRLEVGRSQALPVDDGLPARLPHRGRDLRQAHPGQRQGRKDRRADAERRLRQGLLGRLQGRPRQGRNQAGGQARHL